MQQLTIKIQPTNVMVLDLHETERPWEGISE